MSRKIEHKGTAALLAEVMHAAEMRMAAQIADAIADIKQEDWDKMGKLDVYEWIVDTYHCEDFLEEVLEY